MMGFWVRRFRTYWAGHLSCPKPRCGRPSLGHRSWPELEYSVFCRLHTDEHLVERQEYLDALDPAERDRIEKAELAESG